MRGHDRSGQVRRPSLERRAERTVRRAGIEPGDLIIGVNDKPITGVENLEALSQQGGRFNLVVLDVNTGRAVRVPIDVPAAGRPEAPGRLPLPGNKPDAPVIPGNGASPLPRAPGRSLGVSAEPVTIGQRTAMKVVSVQPDSPGQKAGLEPGDVIVAANGVPITGAEALSAAVRKSGASVSLTVRDTRTGKDTRVEVKLGGEEPSGRCATTRGCTRPFRSGPKAGRGHRNRLLRRRPRSQGDRGRTGQPRGHGRARARRRDRRSQRLAGAAPEGT